MKKIFLLIVFIVVQSAAGTKSQVITVITTVIKKIIIAIDIAIQKLQNKTIWLTEAQKELENTMSKLKLDQIGEWVGKQRVLYKDYYEELQKVKTIIAYYKSVKSVTEKQLQLLAAYKKSWNQFNNDSHFTPAEIVYMGRVYAGILDASLKNTDAIIMVINDFSVQMTDAKRLELINAAAQKMQNNYSDLMRFNTQNQLLSLSRAKDQQEVSITKKLYGLQ